MTPMRCFLAIKPPENVVDALLDLQEGLPGANWSPAENIHLTLLFLGDQPRRALEDLDASLLQVDVAPFELGLRAVGAFGGRDARLVFAGVRESPELRRLQTKLDVAARQAEMEIETRKYAPHVTLARWGRWGRGGVASDQLAGYIERHSLFAAPDFEVESFGLYRSELGRGGAHYELLADYPLRHRAG
ncbi:MAG: RNA 2',3'-cyclic phosphodiesterase [Neomegalonema sp.]|nr:RNA 2',3'-cyclic phosphodiesterase [Neomegalonema sp.]